jgi:hypothetical protein
MRGEPTLHPQLIQFTNAIRNLMSKSQITLTTNGVLLTKKLALEFLYSGNIIIIDCYGKSFDVYKERFKEFNPIDFYEDSTFNPWHRHSANTKKVILMRDLGSTTGKKQRKILNQAGNVDWEKVKKYGLKPLKEPLKKQCAHPFREVAIFVDGSVSICCRDWRLENILYNVNDELISNEFTNNIELYKTRKLLQSKDRTKNIICSRCDFNGGFYLGFIPEV